MQLATNRRAILILVLVSFGAAAANAQESSLDLRLAELFGAPGSPVAMQSPPSAASQAPLPVPVEDERWSSFLPLYGKEAAAAGYELPLPFGVGATFSILSGRDIEVDDLRIGVNGADPKSVSRFVDLGSESDVFNTNLKLDAWILPFLNVYALVGYVYNVSETHVRVDAGPFDYDVKVDTRLDGFVGGGGVTIAGGYRDFFVVVDANYTQTDIGFDDDFRAVTGAIRAGWMTKLGGVSAQFWTGAAYWDTANTAKGHADVPGVGRVDFEADQGPVHSWLLDFGTNLRFERSFEAFADLSFDLHGGVIVTVGPVFRFGPPPVGVGVGAGAGKVSIFR